MQIFDTFYSCIFHFCSPPFLQRWIIDVARRDTELDPFCIRCNSARPRVHVCVGKGRELDNGKIRELQ